MKKLPVILLLCLLLSGLSLPAAAADFAYRSDGQTITIAACYGEDKAIMLPAELDGLPVTAIADGAFRHCLQMEILTIPASITTLGEDLFPAGLQVTVKGEGDSPAARYCADHDLAFEVAEAEAEAAGSVTANDPATLSGRFFSDVEDRNWFAAAVHDLYIRGVVAGYGDGRFLPQNTITRAEFVKLLAAASGDELAAYRGQSVYKDVRSRDWFAPYIAWATDKGVARGYGGNLFLPANKITRQEMMAMLCRYSRYAGVDALPVLVSEVVFSDAAQIAGWAKEDVKMLQMSGVVGGMGNNRLAPLASATRAESAQIISGFLKLLENDYSKQTIKGLLLADGETACWHDGSLRETAVAPQKRNGVLLASLSLYAGYHGCATQEIAGGLRVWLPNSSVWLALYENDTTMELSDGSLVTLPAAPLRQRGELLAPLAALAAYFGDDSQMAADDQVLLVYPQGQTIDTARWLLGYEALHGEKPVEPQPEAVTVTTESYGTSGLGRELSYTAIAPARYSRTVLLIFEQHGFEDEYDRDGQVLVAAAADVIAAFRRVEAKELYNTRLIVVSSANPDGLAEGTTNNGPGRCTIVGATDMNRNWPTSTYQNRSDSRNFTAAPLSVRETQALRDLIAQTEPDVLLDIHGWEYGAFGDSGLADIFHHEMGLPYKAIFSASAGLAATNVSHLSDIELEAAYKDGLIGFSGYLAGYGYEQGIRSALVELQSPDKPNTAGLIRAIRTILAEMR